ncbi:response regulator [Paenibacillus sp. KN14-4R]|uniref:response regulator n=1 Tax=Paenibacillus sp. KN14-4R TaxID=3445773 RepID=UPI003FA053B8
MLMNGTVKIMVVDDTAFMRIMLKNFLTESGFEFITEASNGVEAIRLFKQYRPDIVIMDITMPDMNGIDALKEIKIMDPQAKVIMCSAMGQQELIVESIMAGASDFIVKPFQKERIVEAVLKVAQ